MAGGRIQHICNTQEHLEQFITSAPLKSSESSFITSAALKSSESDEEDEDDDQPEGQNILVDLSLPGCTFSKLPLRVQKCVKTFFQARLPMPACPLCRSTSGIYFRFLNNITHSKSRLQPRYACSTCSDKGHSSRGLFTLRPEAYKAHLNAHGGLSVLLPPSHLALLNGGSTWQRVRTRSTTLPDTAPRSYTASWRGRSSYAPSSAHGRRLLDQSWDTASRISYGNAESVSSPHPTYERPAQKHTPASECTSSALRDYDVTMQSTTVQSSTAAPGVIPPEYRQVDSEGNMELDLAALPKDFFSTDISGAASNCSPPYDGDYYEDYDDAEDNCYVLDWPAAASSILDEGAARPHWVVTF